MKKLFGITILMMAILACGLPSKAATPTAVSPATATNDVAATAQAQNQMSTAVALTVQAQQPAVTEAPLATAVPPTAQPSTPAFGPSSWNGSFLEPWGARVNMTLVVQKVTETTFTAKMSWYFSSCNALLNVKGEIIQDITTATEQSRWALHPDFQSGDKGGLWLRWTQTENVGNPNCYVNTGDWWYLHMRSDGHMYGFRFLNSTDRKPAKGDIDLTLLP